MGCWSDTFKSEEGKSKPVSFIDIKFSGHDIEAMKCRNTAMSTEDYLEFLKSLRNISTPESKRLCPQGVMFRLP